jgi:hypothetical protein
MRQLLQAVRFAHRHGCATSGVKVSRASMIAKPFFLTTGADMVPRTLHGSRLVRSCKVTPELASIAVGHKLALQI